MAELVVRAAAAYVGFLIGGPYGAQIGFALGGFLVPSEKIDGARLDNLTAPKLQYGTPLLRLYGLNRVSVAPIWVSDLQPHENTEEQGKGGGAEVTTTTYTIDILLGCAIDTQAVGISRVWLNKKLVYNVQAPPADANPTKFQQFITAIVNSNTTPAWQSISLFDGNAAQLPWSVYEAAVGIGNAPAYRHRTTIGIQGLDVGTSGQPPLIEVELFTAGSASVAGHSDNFADGVHAWTGDILGFFNSGDGEYGPFIEALGRGADGLGVKEITKSFPIANVTGMRVKFMMFAQLTDDAGEFGVFDGASQLKFSIVPRREAAVDPLQRCHVFINLVEVTLGAAALQMLTWYEFQCDLIDGAGNSLVRLINLATGAVVDEQNVPGLDAAFFTVESLSIDTEGNCGDTFYSALDMPGAGAVILPVDLADIVTAECQRVGLSAGQIDVTDLVGIDVTGYATSKAARPTLEELAVIFYFEAFCDDKIRFVRRGGASAATIAYEETGASVNEPGEPFNGMDRADELAVPAFYAVSFPDVTRDHEMGSVMSDRLVGASSEVRQVQGAVVMTPSQAKGRADSYAADARVGAHNGNANLTVAHIARTPTDVITLNDIDGTSYRARIVRMAFTDWVMQCETVLDDPNTLVDAGIAPADGEPAVSVDVPGVTFLQLIDGPILRDEDNDAGMYAATRISSGTGSGSRVFKSLDGVTFTTVGDVPSQAIGGTATTALADVANPYVWDEVSTVTVSSSAALSSSTRAAMQADATINLMALASGSGWEYLRFRTAALLSPGVYMLSGFLRGLRGTESFVDGHAVGDRFVMLRTAGMIRAPGTSAEIGLERFYKGITLGAALTSSAGVAHTHQAIGLKPFAPTQLRADRDTSGNVTFTWARRTRLLVRYGGPGGTLAPLGEDSEAYQVDIYNAGNVVRTLSATSESVAYSAAQQTADFGAPVSAGALDSEVFQVSQTVGRGYGFRKSV